MGSIKGFIDIKRETPPGRSVEERLKDWKEVYHEMSMEKYHQQGARCMDCGIPFCQSNTGCPLGNMIPDWNDMVYRDRWGDAFTLMQKTNNFPEFTGRVCPAPCEGACVLGISEPAVTIRSIEQIIADKAHELGISKPRPPAKRTNKNVAVVGSGPAGLAAADQLNSAGHSVTVFEKDDRIGGLLMYGIPHFKLDKEVVKRRIKLMEEEGVTFKTGSHIGIDISIKDLQKDYNAVLLAGGAQKPRDLPIEGRNLKGIHFAMEFLLQQNKRLEGDTIPELESIIAQGKNVLIIGGGDTGSDCLGTSLRQGAKNVVQFELLSEPPENREKDNPWPEWPRIYRISSSHEEAIKEVRDYCVMTKKFTGESGQVKQTHALKVEWVRDHKTGKFKPQEIADSEFVLNVDLVLLAMGFVHPIHDGMVTELGVKLDGRGNVACDNSKMTSVPGIFVAGDMTRGQSLVVWAIAEGREAARSIDEFLMGTSVLPHSEFL